MIKDIVIPDAVFFDWDGTLVDSYGFLNDAHGFVLDKLGFPPFREGEYREYFGMPREILYPKIYKDKGEEAKAIFEGYVLENSHKIKPLDGADHLLAILKELGISMGVVSNKKSGFIQKEIEHLGWGDYFSAIIGAGQAEKDKPSGAPLLLALQQSGIDRDGDVIWYVGDTENDLACAAEAGCHAIFIRGVSDTDALLAKYEPLVAVNNCHDLKEILVAIS